MSRQFLSALLAGLVACSVQAQVPGRQMHWSADGNALATPDLAAKIVIIPASIIKSGRYSAEFLKDYKAVQKEFSLPD